MSQKVIVKSGGVSAAFVLFLIFLVLKLAQIGVVASWSWWWVTSPLWIPWLVVLGFAAIVGVVALIVWCCKELAAAMRRRSALGRMMGDE